MSDLRLRVRRIAAGCAVAVVAASGIAGAGAVPAGAITPPTCPAAAGNARLVRYTYIAALGRCPDAGGLAYWTDELDDGLPRDVMVATIAFSDEALGHLADQWFDRVLDRAPSLTERNAAIALVRADADDTLLTAQLGGSDEFFTRLTGELPVDQRDNGWLNVAFQSVLHRLIDPGGRTYFLGIMGSPSTAAGRYVSIVVMGRSAEGARQVVEEEIEEQLRRTPDAGGVDYWANWLMQPGQFSRLWLRVILLSSDEGAALAQTQPEVFSS